MAEYYDLFWEGLPEIKRKIEVRGGGREVEGPLLRYHGKELKNFPTNLTSEEVLMLYSTAFSFCPRNRPPDYSNYCEMLNEKYKEVFEQYLSETVMPSVSNELHGFPFLQDVIPKWKKYTIMARWLGRFLGKLKDYFKKRSGLSVMKGQGLVDFRNMVYHTLKEEARDAILALIEREREGERIDRTLVKRAVDSFVAIGDGQLKYYEEDFEDIMIGASAEYYSRKASIWIVEDSCPAYLLKAEECLEKERDMVSDCLHSTTKPKLLEKIQQKLLVVYSSHLLENEHSGCRALLRDDKGDDLTRMYRLFFKITKGLDPVALIFKQHVTDEGIALVQQAKDRAQSAGVSQEQVFLRKVIELYDKYVAYVTDYFASHSLFHKSLKEAFEVFCNKQVGCSSAELLASFCDNILKKGGSEELSDEAFEDTLDKVMKLLVSVSDKDLFAEFFWKKLARRLLFDRSASDGHEGVIVSKLKQHCGGQFTSKMEGMVTDLTLAKENQNNFGEYVKANSNVNPAMVLSVTVLTTGFWPTFKSSYVSLPAELAKCVQVFKDFYQTNRKHRKLTWIYSLGTCNVHGKFDQGTIELVVGTYQAAALLLFNASDKLSYSEIKLQLNLADEDLVRVLQSLACGKYKILNKEPNSRTVSPNDSFQFNSKFTDRMRKIKIPLPTVDGRRKVVNDVDKDRSHAIDVSLLRIMKSRKVLGHQQLVMECVEQLSRTSLKPDFKVIKKRMEDLIAREYLERDKENPNLFRYLAS